MLSRNFEEWAQDLGFNTDSRRAYGIWQSCQAQTIQFTKFIKGDLLLFCRFVRLIDQEGSLEAAEEEFFKEEENE